MCFIYFCAISINSAFAADISVSAFSSNLYNYQSSLVDRADFKAKARLYSISQLINSIYGDTTISLPVGGPVSVNLPCDSYFKLLSSALTDTSGPIYKRLGYKYSITNSVCTNANSADLDRLEDILLNIRNSNGYIDIVIKTLNAAVPNSIDSTLDSKGHHYCSDAVVKINEAFKNNSIAVDNLDISICSRSLDGDFDSLLKVVTQLVVVYGNKLDFVARSVNAFVSGSQFLIPIANIPASSSLTVDQCNALVSQINNVISSTNLVQDKSLKISSKVCAISDNK